MSHCRRYAAYGVADEQSHCMRSVRLASGPLDVGVRCRHLREA